MKNPILRAIRLLAFGAMAGALTPEAMAVPAYPGALTHIQPDGSVVTFFRSGDEFHHEIHDAEGRMLAFNDEGWLLPVTEQEAAALRSREAVKSRQYLMSGTAFPCEGEPHGLVILTEFANKSFSMSDPNKFYTRMLNEEGFSDYKGTGSARDFFIDNSRGRFKPVFDVYGPVKLTYDYAYYGRNDAWDEDMHPEEMVLEALELLDPEVDFSKYDTDGDGVIDNVFVFYAGFGEADYNDPNTVWPHSFDIFDLNLPKKYVFDGVEPNRYAMTNEIEGTLKRPDGIGTFVHEFSHVLGLPDLYTTTYTNAFTPGDYSTLDSGPYNNNGLTPPAYSIFERHSLGWVEPREIKESGDYSLRPITDSDEAFIIKTEKDNEFYLLENRQQSGWDTYIPGHGMIVWHVDFDQDIWDRNVVNTQRNHQYVDLVEADGKATSYTRNADPFPGHKNITQFTAETSPALKSWAGRPLGVSLTEITEQDGVIRFNATFAPSGVTEIGASSMATHGITAADGLLTNDGEAAAEIYDLSGRHIGRVAPGAGLQLQRGVYIVNVADSTLKIRL